MSLESVLSGRHRLLGYLVEQPRTKRELEELADCSRSTVDRGVRQLVDERLAARHDGRWEATPLGRSAHEAHVRYRRDLDRFAALGPLADALPEEAVCDAVLAGARPHAADAAVPDAVAGTVLDRLDRGDRVSFATPFLGAGFLRRVRGRTAADSHIALTVADEAVDRLADAHPDLVGAVSASQSVALRRAAVPFEFGVWLVPDDHAGVVVLGDHGVAGLLVNDSPAAMSWARERLRRVGAHPVAVEA